MSEDYRSGLFDVYHARSEELDGDESEKAAWFEDYVHENYLPHVVDGDVLEIGCNRGYVLAALHRFGHGKVVGIDLSPGDVSIAARIAPEAHVEVADAFAYLEDHPDAYDTVIMKAVLEHIQKPRILPLLRSIHGSLRPGGVAIIDVPNMDWLFASHERYMDFTHEAGFTPQSLSQVVGLVFGDVQIHPVEARAAGRRASLQQRVGRGIVGTLLRWADGQGAGNPIWARSIIAVGRK